MTAQAKAATRYYLALPPLTTQNQHSSSNCRLPPNQETTALGLKLYELHFCAKTKGNFSFIEPINL
jgi:hypothetical protein